MRVIAELFGPYAPDALPAHISVFSHDFKRFERLTKLATSSIPEITFPLAFTGLQACDHLLATAVLVRCWRLRRGPLNAFPDVAFFDQTFDGFGTHAFARLLLHRLDDFLDIFEGVVEILVHCFVLFVRDDRSTSTQWTCI